MYSQAALQNECACPHFACMSDHTLASHVTTCAMELADVLNTNLSQPDLGQPCAEDQDMLSQHREPESEYRGVISTKSGRWRALIGIDGTNENWGNFEDEEDAARAFDRCAIEVGRQPNLGPLAEDEKKDEDEGRPAHCKQSQYHGVSLDTRCSKCRACQHTCQSECAPNSGIYT